MDYKKLLRKFYALSGALKMDLENAMINLCSVNNEYGFKWITIYFDRETPALKEFGLKESYSVSGMCGIDRGEISSNVSLSADVVNFVDKFWKEIRNEL